MLPMRFVNRVRLPEFHSDRVFAPFRAIDSFVEGLECAGAGLRFDVREEEQRYVVETDVPGFAQSDLDITLEDGLLTIAAEKVTEDESAERHYHVRERRSGRLSRSIRLAEDVNTEAVKASLKNGVLTIVLEKAESAKPHKIGAPSLCAPRECSLRVMCQDLSLSARRDRVDVFPPRPLQMIERAVCDF